MLLVDRQWGNKSLLTELFVRIGEYGVDFAFPQQWEQRRIKGLWQKILLIPKLHYEDDNLYPELLIELLYVAIALFYYSYLSHP